VRRAHRRERLCAQLAQGMELVKGVGNEHRSGRQSADDRDSAEEQPGGSHMLTKVSSTAASATRTPVPTITRTSVSVLTG